MFVNDRTIEEKSKINLFTIRNRPLWVSNSERLASPILDRSVSPKASGSAYKKLFDMTEERNFVPEDRITVTVTPAQLKLLELLDHTNAADFAHHVKEVHELGTYFVTSKDLVNLSASLHVHWLYEAIYAIAQEQSINLKSA